MRKVTILIPVLNEEQALPATIAFLGLLSHELEVADQGLREFVAPRREGAEPDIIRATHDETRRLH